MSYIDGKNVPGSHSPFTVWLRHSGGYVVGVSFHLLNDYIQKYKIKRDIASALNSGLGLVITNLAMLML